MLPQLSVASAAMDASNSLCVVRTGGAQCGKGSQDISHMCRGDQGLQGVNKEDGWA